MKVFKLALILVLGLLIISSTSAAIGDKNDPAESCKQISDLRSGADSGVYWINPDGNYKFEIYCDMDYDGGGWTILMNIDQTNNQFGYSSDYWTNDETFNTGSQLEPNDGSDDISSKYESFSRLKGDELMVTFSDPEHQIRYVDFNSMTAEEIFTSGENWVSYTDGCKQLHDGFRDYDSDIMRFGEGGGGFGINIDDNRNYGPGEARLIIGQDEDTSHSVFNQHIAIGTDDNSIIWNSDGGDSGSCGYYGSGYTPSGSTTSGSLWIRENETYEQADFKAEISGPDQVSSGSVAQFFGTIENTGGLSGEPGILTVEKDGDDGGESWNAGNLNPGESFEEGRFVSFGSAGTYQLCAQVTDDSASDCKTVTATDSGGPGGWKNLVNFELDLTGPDSGIGWDEDDGAALDIEARDGRKVVFTDIYWQGFDTDNYWGSGGPLSTYLNEHEAPMCGDDQREYLLEEIGESTNSEKFNGRYACADSYEYCVFRGKTGRKIFEREETVNTDEDTEQEGRLKLDDEVCAQRPGLESTSMTRDFDITPIWYDQDYANEISGTGDINVPDQNLCRENNLYGPSGARWINKDYIQDYPNSVTGGIDDSWNPELERRGHPSLESRPDQSTYSNNIIDNGNTPVDTGTLGSKVARPTNMDYGFCGGDDSSEYLIYQDSQTDLVETDQEVIGVASDPNSCVLENSRLVNSEDGGVRDLYEEGESVSFDSGDTRRTIQCFDGQWWGEWPIVFYEDVSRFDLGETGFIPFMVINPTDESRELNLDLNPRGPESEDINQITSFESTGGDEMVLTVPAESSVTQRLEISANREIDTTGQDSQHIAVIGESTNGNLDGEDRVDLVVEANDGTGSSSNIRDIPGLTFVQMILIALVSTMMFIFRK